MNYTTNDRGEQVIAVGAPGSIKRAECEYPNLIAKLNQQISEGAQDPKGMLQEMLNAARAPLSVLEIRSLLIAAGASNQVLFLVDREIPHVRQPAGKSFWQVPERIITPEGLPPRGGSDGTPVHIASAVAGGRDIRLLGNDGRLQVVFRAPAESGQPILRSVELPRIGGTNWAKNVAIARDGSPVITGLDPFTGRPVVATFDHSEKIPSSKVNLLGIVGEPGLDIEQSIARIREQPARSPLPASSTVESLASADAKIFGQFLRFPGEMINGNPAVVRMNLIGQKDSWTTDTRDYNAEQKANYLRQHSPNMAAQMEDLHAHPLAFVGDEKHDSVYAVRHNEIPGDTRTVELGLVWGVHKELTASKQSNIWVFRPLGRFDGIEKAIDAANNIMIVGPQFIELATAAPALGGVEPTFEAGSWAGAVHGRIREAIGATALAEPQRFDTTVHRDGMQVPTKAVTGKTFEKEVSSDESISQRLKSHLQKLAGLAGGSGSFVVLYDSSRKSHPVLHVSVDVACDCTYNPNSPEAAAGSPRSPRQMMDTLQKLPRDNQALGDISIGSTPDDRLQYGMQPGTYLEDMATGYYSLRRTAGLTSLFMPAPSRDMVYEDSVKFITAAHDLAERVQEYDQRVYDDASIKPDASLATPDGPGVALQRADALVARRPGAPAI